MSSYSKSNGPKLPGIQSAAAPKSAKAARTATPSAIAINPQQNPEFNQGIPLDLIAQDLRTKTII